MYAVAGRSSARSLQSKYTRRKMTIFNLYTLKYFANGKQWLHYRQQEVAYRLWNVDW